MNYNLKINILFDFQESPYGGGNQFLKALKEQIILNNVYEENPEKADIILFNSHHKVKEVINLKKKFPDKIFIHRIDGPIYKIREADKKTDNIIYKINKHIADGTIFQSDWSLKENEKLGFHQFSPFQEIITNAPNPKIFNTKQKSDFNPKNKIKLIATSWSSNINKGFNIYKYLDNNLDFSKYQMTFIGNSPIKFKNIKHIKPLKSYELSQKLKEHDIFITASKNDPCSNSLIEALHCSLPAIALNSGGHPEIIKKGGLIFNNEEEIIDKINTISLNYNEYQNNIEVSSIKNVSEKYITFCKNILSQKMNHKYSPKKINFINKILLKFI